jgi:hypothetical protein
MQEIYAHRLIAALSSPATPTSLTTAWVSSALGTDWRTLSKRLLGRPGVKLALAALGWEYRPQRGRKGGLFIRAGVSAVPAAEAAVGLPWATISRASLWYPTAVAAAISVPVPLTADRRA